MALIEGGELGFDEGGVLQSLSKPIYTTKVIDYERNRKGEVTQQRETNYTISMADIIVAAALVLGPIVFLKLRAGLPNTVPDGFTNLPIDDLINSSIGLTPSAPQMAVIKKIIDPFGWIWK